MHETHSIIPLSFTFFAAFSLTSAIVLDTPLQLLSTSEGSNNTTITNNYHNNALPFSLPSNHPTSNSSRPFSPPPPTSAVFLSYVCNGDAFGYDLDVPSCNNAIRFVGFNTTERSFGMRDSREFDILLPQRFISSNGKCVIEPALAPGVTEARASPEDIAVASVAVVRNCAAKTPSRGGIAKDIGGDDKLRVVVSKYDPENVRCYGKMRRPNAHISCMEILTMMQTDDRNMFWGPRTDPLAEEVLPLFLLSGS
ncbi:MAG: hypothetical protein Q9175_007066 [Cornicularia normoerica]